MVQPTLTGDRQPLAGYGSAFAIILTASARSCVRRKPCGPRSAGGVDAVGAARPPARHNARQGGVCGGEGQCALASSAAGSPNVPPIPTPTTTGGQGSPPARKTVSTIKIRHITRRGGRRKHSIALCFSLPNPLGAGCDAQPVAGYDFYMYDSRRVVAGVFTRKQRVADN